MGPMFSRRKRFLPAMALCASLLLVPNARTAPADDVKALTERARQAFTSANYGEAATLYEALSQSKPIATQDDVEFLLLAAQSYARAGQRDKAVTLWERVLKVPAAPGARPPGMLPGPRDYRGEARWGIAESRRAQGHWSEALELYQLNRATYPRDDGCVPSGAAFQTMALVESVCLENLGRTDEAVKLLWPAALRLSGGPPHAMRRLIDLYAKAGQIAVLEAAVAREAQAYQAYFRTQFGGSPHSELRENEQKMLKNELARSAFPAFERVRHFRKAARERRWSVLLAALHFKPNERYETALDHQIPSWNRREAIAALALVYQEAAPILERALKTDAANPYLRAAWLFCLTPEQRQNWLAQSKNDGETQKTLQEAVSDGSYNLMPLSFPTPPATLQLPSELPPVFQKP